MTHPRPVPIPRRFEGRTVVVTGAGTGFGAAIALRAAQEGAKAVGIHYRSSRQGAEETARRVEEAGAATAFFQADIAEWITRRIAEGCRREIHHAKKRDGQGNRRHGCRDREIRR